MPETKLKPLYIGKSISDLKVLYNVDEFIKGKKATMYKLLNEQQKIEAEQLVEEEREAMEELKRKQVNLEKPTEDTSLVNGMPGANDVSISSRQLYSLLNEKKMNILILDSRPATCYAESRMTVGNCINVPEKIVEAGRSAAALEKSLPPESKLAWGKRKDADLVVLLDWFTTEKSHQPGTNLYTLKSILIKWDPDIIYKSAPLILEGGYEEWLLKYPMLTTNSQVKPPHNPGLSEMDDLLDDVEYPNLMDASQPVIDRASKPPSCASGSLTADSMNSVQVVTQDSVSEVHSKVFSSSSDRTSSIVRPSVDRGSKAAALQTYKERSEAVTELLRAKGLAIKSQVMEESKLEADKEWEVLRISKEKEAEEERTKLLQNREEELLLSISKLEENLQAEEIEKQLLKDKLEHSKQLEEAAEKAQSQKKEAEAKEEDVKQLVKEQEGRKASEERQRMKDAEQTKKLEEEKQKERESQEHEKGTYYTQLKNDEPSRSGIMKRSHSSPNIAQLVEDLDVGVKHKPPQFDRKIKPLQKPQPSEINAARQRDFSAVYGNKGHGITGLKNLGNTCYMNSIIQCINNTTPLVRYFCLGDYHEDVNHHNNSTQGEVAEEVAAVVRALWSGEFRSITCRDLKRVVGQHRKQFQGYEQQDSHEFFTILMDWLHEDLNKRSRKSPLKETSNDNLSPADQAWDKFRRCNVSLIRNLFYGQQKSTVRCCKCSEESETYEAFSDLSLPLPSSSNKCSLNECIKLYLYGEKISGWNCPSCKEKRDAIKKFDIQKLPPILVIHLNRFYHDGWWRKRQTYVDFPFHLDMSQFTLVPGQRYVSYDLYGISNHYGTMEGGHYTAYCKNAEYGKWYKFDDHEVSEISNNSVRSGAAYILFYSSVEYKVPGNSS
ncbi:ubiquitin carboxyl-terminal hydrolase 8 isoform X2 [Zootermopsis nevadensis]|uniref:ubiquitin carboxyl-terminal hydrolase 8 isoform X2 n=1 Tax=Zootermopsis nevadensis TaxID=136037 RepID=UPI000B8E2617|nr:ubiquitin carboxyl-terminal hydrolase 8 isoform X2 [Zootermopsis nevadensis]